MLGIGLTRDYIVYDEDDSKRIMRDILDARVEKMPIREDASSEVMRLF